VISNPGAVSQPTFSSVSILTDTVAAWCVTSCERVIFSRDTSRLARPAASTTRAAPGTCCAPARRPGHRGRGRPRPGPFLVNTIAMQATTDLLADVGPARLDAVRVIGVDEHRWAHTRHAAGDGFVTVIVDLTPRHRHRTGPAAGPGPGALLGRAHRLAGRAHPQVPAAGADRGDGRVRRLQQRRHQRDSGRGDRDGPLPRRRARRGQQAALDRRAAPRTRSTGPGARCRPASSCSAHASRPAWRRCSPTSNTPRSRSSTGSTADHRRLRHPDPRQGRTLLTGVIDTIRSGVPAGSRSLPRWGAPGTDVVTTYWPSSLPAPRTAPTEAINGRLEALRRSALGFRNLINYRLRACSTADTYLSRQT